MPASMLPKELIDAAKTFKFPAKLLRILHLASTRCDIRYAEFTPAGGPVLGCQKAIILRIIPSLNPRTGIVPPPLNHYLYLSDIDSINDRAFDKATEAINDYLIEIEALKTGSFTTTVKKDMDSISLGPIDIDKHLFSKSIDISPSITIIKKISEELESRGDFEINISKLVDILFKLDVIKAKEDSDHDNV